MTHLNNNKSERDKLEDEIKQLETVDNGVTKPTLDRTVLQEAQYVAPTDGELEREAKAGLESYRTDGIKSIKENSAAEEQQLVDKRAQYETGYKTSADKLKSSYDAAAESIDNDVIKRGLARSSIAVNAKSELERDYAAKTAELSEKYQKELTEIDSEIAAIGSKLKIALNDFNLSYAAKLNGKLSELKTARENKQQEIIKFNNDVRQKQARLDSDRLLTESKLYSEQIAQEKAASLESLSAADREQIYKAIYQRMDRYLSSLSPTDAKLEIRNHTLYRKHLSDYYYYSLYDKYGR